MVVTRHMVAGRTRSHVVEEDTVKTLTRVNAEVTALRQSLGPDGIIVITVTGHVPSKPLLVKA